MTSITSSHLFQLLELEPGIATYFSKNRCIISDAVWRSTEFIIQEEAILQAGGVKESPAVGPRVSPFLSGKAGGVGCIVDAARQSKEPLKASSSYPTGS